MKVFAKKFRVVALAGFVLAARAFGAEPVVPPAATATNTDARTLVTLPESAREFLRQDMQDHLLALNEILSHLADNNLAAAADVAEDRMGFSAMGRHRASGMAPGRFMPPDMHNMGMAMHQAASEFSKVAKSGDTKAVYGALQKLTATCVACHYSYRTR